MEYPVTPDEFRPVTIDAVISRVPVNPSCMSLSCRVQAVTHTHLEPSPKEARPYLSAFYPMIRSGLGLGELPANVPLSDYGRSQKIFGQTTAALTANPQAK